MRPNPPKKVPQIYFSEVGGVGKRRKRKKKERQREGGRKGGRKRRREGKRLKRTQVRTGEMAQQ